MVSSKAVNDVHVIPQCLLIFLCDQHGAHLAPEVAYALQVSRGEEEVVGGNFTRDGQAAFLGQLNDQNLRPRHSSRSEHML